MLARGGATPAGNLRCGGAGLFIKPGNEAPCRPARHARITPQKMTTEGESRNIESRDKKTLGKTSGNLM